MEFELQAATGDHLQHVGNNSIEVRRATNHRLKDHTRQFIWKANALLPPCSNLTIRASYSSWGCLVFAGSSLMATSLPCGSSPS